MDDEFVYTEETPAVDDSLLNGPRWREERDWLLRRVIADHELHTDVVGASSTAMLIAAMTDREPDRRPYDVYDLNRCERTYESAPAHLQRRMRPILERFRQIVRADADQRHGWFAESLRTEHRPAALGEKQNRGTP